MGNFGNRNAYQIQTVSLAANMSFTEWSLKVTEARIPGVCLITPGCYCPVCGEIQKGREWRDGIMGENRKASGVPNGT